MGHGSVDPWPTWPIVSSGSIPWCSMYQPVACPLSQLGRTPKPPCRTTAGLRTETADQSHLRHLYPVGLCVRNSTTLTHIIVHLFFQILIKHINTIISSLWKNIPQKWILTNGNSAHRSNSTYTMSCTYICAAGALECRIKLPPIKSHAMRPFIKILRPFVL